RVRFVARMRGFTAEGAEGAEMETAPMGAVSTLPATGKATAAAAKTIQPNCTQTLQPLTVVPRMIPPSPYPRNPPDAEGPGCGGRQPAVPESPPHSSASISRRPSVTPPYRRSARPEFRRYSKLPRLHPEKGAPCSAGG